MIEHLTKLRLPVDDLLRRLALEESLEEVLRPHRRCPCRSASVTLDMVRNETLRRAARRYITELLNEKERYGYLYFLHSQRLVIPLTVQFKSDLFVEYGKSQQIQRSLGELAQEFAAVDTHLYDITMVELLYFFIRLVNPSLSWMALDYQLQCVRSHAHLIASPDRPYSWRRVEA